MNIRLILLCLMMALPGVANAGVEAFLQNLGYRANAASMTGSPADVVNGGSMGGGSFSLRPPSQANIQPLFSITAPSIHAGCSGIDLDTGGLYMMLDPQIMLDRLQSFGSSAIYGVVVGLMSSIPVIGDSLKGLDKVMRQLGDNLKGGCQMGKQLGADLGDKLKSKISNDGADKDSAAGDDEGKATDEKATKKAIDYNLVFQAMAGSTVKEAMFIVNLVGTVLFRSDGQPGGGYKQSKVKAKFTLQELVDGLPEGETLKSWDCTADKDEVIKSIVTIPPAAGVAPEPDEKKCTTIDTAVSQADGGYIYLSSSKGPWDDLIKDTTTRLRLVYMFNFNGTIFNAPVGASLDVPASSPAPIVWATGEATTQTVRQLLDSIASPGPGPTVTDSNRFVNEYSELIKNGNTLLLKIIAGLARNLNPSDYPEAKIIDSYLDKMAKVFVHDYIDKELDRVLRVEKIGLGVDVTEGLLAALMTKVGVAKVESATLRAKAFDELQKDQELMAYIDAMGNRNGN